MSQISAVISDFGGVLTSPLADSFRAFQKRSGIPLEALGKAMAAIGARRQAHPMAAIETGQITEAEFLSELECELEAQLERSVTLARFGEQFLENLHPNQRLIDYLRGLATRGYKLAICTNNIREWESLWRAKLPVDEIFDVVVDSAFVGTRKPEARIYEITLERLGVSAQAALLIDDVEVNCAAARALGMSAVWFQSTDQAIEATEAALAEG